MVEKIVNVMLFQERLSYNIGLREKRKKVTRDGSIDWLKL